MYSSYTLFRDYQGFSRIENWLSRGADALTSIVFPGDCRICERLLTTASRVPICDFCLGSFERVAAPVCETCGVPLAHFQGEAAQTDVCSACRQRGYGFERARSFAVYEGALVRAVLLLKFQQIEPLAGWFAGRLEEVIRRESPTLPFDAVVPVPLHRQRLRERGYNQAALVAKPLARRLGLPCRPVLLMRTRPRPDKHILSESERWESVRGAFATVPGSRVDNLRVLLVDDVMTTGATLDVCSQALRAAGAKSVMGLTIARAVQRHAPSSGG